MYFDRRLFAMTKGVRWRMVLAALLGIVAVPVAIWRLTLTGAAIAEVFQGAALSSLVATLILVPD